jgi:OOP family OmpA-OmpF porin
VFDTNNKFADSPVFAVTTTVETVESKRKANKYDERVDTYTVFAFNYGTNTIMAEDAAVKRLSSAIRQTLKAGATVEITGFTDSRGSADGNKRLSQERAQAVAKLLGVENAIVTGVGATNQHDNTLPEGRFYNRFVQVDIRTPVR